MMGNTFNSDSIEQRSLEKEMRQQMCEIAGVDKAYAEAPESVHLTSEPEVSVAPDLYSESDKVIGEFYAHIGALKPAQKHKIAADALKMIMLEKDKGQKFRKIIFVCCDEVKKYLEGKSYLAAALRTFGVKVEIIRLSEEQRQKIIAAQKRQKMINI